ncbi:hypothetical protein TWF506_003443 [Arthrobotrys conoides]|uniref:Phospholipase A-2-activating protein n=1 Tax=Arthrobotrys conoides TaxID=74498 RepID=A0AAN8N3Z0_9PEZI
MAKDLPFKLSQTLVGHSEDVKDVLFVDPTTIISCSRDATVRIWNYLVVEEEGEGNNDAYTGPSSETPSESDVTKPTASGFVDTINSNAQGFVNCLAYMKPDDDHPKGLVISAGQESLIDVRPPGYLGPDAAYLLIGHSGNVCSLDVHGTTIISGSWDKTAIVWKNWEKKYVLEGHTAAVWAVMAVSDTEFITGCADGQIRWYRENQLYRSVQAHTQPVRGIQKLNDEKDGVFISCGNDGIIKSWSKEGREIETVYAHTAYIYSITVLPNGEWASCGEDRTLKVWRKSQCLQSISHPCISVWCVSASPNGDLVTGASDGVLRVWSREAERHADHRTLKAYSEAIANLTIAEETMEIDKESLPGMSALGRPGKHNGEKIHINNDGNIEAYQWSSSETTWEQVGVVASAVSSGRKVEYEGQFYDYVFDVDFEEGKPPKKLPFNASQNPWEAAQIFLDKNDLPKTYLDTTANFIIQNTRGTQLGASQQPQLPASADPFGIENRYRPGDELNQPPAPPPPPPKVLPWKTYLDIASVNLDAATKKILEHNAHFLSMNQKEKTLNDEDVNTLKALTGFLAKPSSPTSASAKSSAAVKNGLALLIKIISEWEGVRNLAALDLLRTLARYSPAVVLSEPDLLEVLDNAKCFVSKNTSHATFGSRVLLNLFHHSEGLEYVTGDKAIEIIEMVGTGVEESQNRLALISADTFFLNFAVYLSKQQDPTSEKKAICLLQALLKRIERPCDTEALYRSIMGLGTLMATGSKFFWYSVYSRGAQKIVSDVLQRIDKEKEKRIVDVVTEIEGLFAKHPQEN